MTVLFDSHCHLQDRAFRDDQDATVGRALAAGVAGMLVLGCDPTSNREAIALARRHREAVYAAVGIHPHDAASVSDADLAEVAHLAELPEVVAVGEIGLDFYRNLSPAASQDRVLAWHLRLALEVGKPVCVHSRAAEDAILPPLVTFAAAWRARHGDRLPGVMHCFGGTLAQARAFADEGFLVSLACAVTYPKSADARAIAAALPLDSLLIETDSPYLPPQQLRGKRNEPAHVGAAAAAIADVRSVPIGEVARRTTDNAMRLLGIRPGVLSGAGTP